MKLYAGDVITVLSRVRALDSDHEVWLEPGYSAEFSGWPVSDAPQLITADFMRGGVLYRIRTTMNNIAIIHSTALGEIDMELGGDDPRNNSRLLTLLSKDVGKALVYTVVGCSETATINLAGAEGGEFYTEAGRLNELLRFGIWLTREVKRSNDEA